MLMVVRFERGSCDWFLELGFRALEIRPIPCTDQISNLSSARENCGAYSRCSFQIAEEKHRGCYSKKLNHQFDIVVSSANSPLNIVDLITR